MRDHDLFRLHPGAVIGDSLFRKFDSGPAPRDAAPEPAGLLQRESRLSEALHALPRSLSAAVERILSPPA